MAAALAAAATVVASPGTLASAASPPGATAFAPLPPEIADPLPGLPDGRTRLLSLDLGPAGPVAPGYQRYSVPQRPGSVAWLRGLVRERMSVTPAAPLLAGFAEGEDATLAIGIRIAGADSACRIQLVLADPDTDRGPVDVLVGGSGEGVTPVAQAVVTRAGLHRIVEFEAVPANDRISVRLRSLPCRPWAATAVIVYAPPGARLVPLVEFRDRRPPVPPPDALVVPDREAMTALLRTYGDFLLAERLSDGGFSHAGAWYQNAYPIRALLAGGRLLDEPAFTEAALDRLDRFVGRQLADGRWYSTYGAAAECEGAVAPDDTSSANLADIGSMSLCLALAAPLADSARAARYVEAARRYADGVVLPEQLPDGSFPNRRWMGRDHRHPYSVATATQASSLAALGLLLGEDRYLDAAARAGTWLAGTIRDDGTIAFHAHDRESARWLRAHDLGDAFYIVEALTWIVAVEGSRDRLDGSEARVAADSAAGELSAAASAARAALERYLWGVRGLRATADYGYWWKPLSMWTSSKMAAVPYLLARWREDGATHRDEVNTWIDRAVAWLADPGYARRIGVLAPYEAPTGEYGLVATGFAAMGLAEVLRPGVLVPNPAAFRTRVGATARSATSSHGPRPR